MNVIKHIIAVYFGLMLAGTFISCGLGAGVAFYEGYTEGEYEDYDDGSYYVYVQWTDSVKTDLHIERQYQRIYTYEGSDYIDRTREFLGLYDSPTGGTLYVNANGYIVRDLRQLKGNRMTLYAVYRTMGNSLDGAASAE